MVHQVGPVARRPHSPVDMSDNTQPFSVLPVSHEIRHVDWSPPKVWICRPYCRPPAYVQRTKIEVLSDIGLFGWTLASLACVVPHPYVEDPHSILKRQQPIHCCTRVKCVVKGGRPQRGARLDDVRQARDHGSYNPPQDPCSPGLPGGHSGAEPERRRHKASCGD